MKNIMWMLGGVGVGMTISKYGKDIKKIMKKEKKMITKTAKDLMNSN